MGLNLGAATDVVRCEPPWTAAEEDLADRTTMASILPRSPRTAFYATTDKLPTRPLRSERAEKREMERKMRQTRTKMMKLRGEAKLAKQTGNLRPL